MRVTNPDGGSYTCKTCASFVAGPKLDPATTIAGTRTRSQTVHLTGTGFVAGLTLTGPAGVTFTNLVVSPTEVTATMAVAGTTPIASGQKDHRDQPGQRGVGHGGGQHPDRVREDRHQLRLICPIWGISQVCG